MSQDGDYSNYVIYGPDTNCTLALCPASISVYQYQPTLAGNICFLLLFALALLIHIVMGIKWRTWFFFVGMVCGCVSEILGYAGRIMLHQNPFSFNGFLLQIICIAFAPVFYTAAIYITLYRIILYLGPQHARFAPKLYYWIFIPCDILSLVLQAVGGALSSSSSGGSKTAVYVSIAGLSFQVFTLCVFIGLAIDYGVRWSRARQQPTTPLTRSFKIFVSFLSLSIVLILIRCAYRIDELSDGYNGPLIHDEGLFIALEGVMVLVAVYCLMIAHPGPVFQGFDDEKASRDGRLGVDQEGQKEGM